MLERRKRCRRMSTLKDNVHLLLVKTVHEKTETTAYCEQDQGVCIIEVAALSRWLHYRGVCAREVAGFIKEMAAL